MSPLAIHLDGRCTALRKILYIVGSAMLLNAAKGSTFLAKRITKKQERASPPLPLGWQSKISISCCEPAIVFILTPFETSVVRLDLRCPGPLNLRNRKPRQIVTFSPPFCNATWGRGERKTRQGGKKHVEICINRRGHGGAPEVEWPEEGKGVALQATQSEKEDRQPSNCHGMDRPSRTCFRPHGSPHTPLLFGAI